MKQFAFYKKYEGFVLKDTKVLELVGMESEGDDLRELISNVQLHVVDGLGSEIHVPISMLCNEDYVRVEADIVRLYHEQMVQDKVKPHGKMFTFECADEEGE